MIESDVRTDIPPNDTAGIHVEAGLIVRFPGQSDDFLEGVEIGLLLAVLASDARSFVCRLHRRSVAQATELATAFRYRCVPPSELTGDERDLVEIRFESRQVRPKLSLV